MADWTQRLRKLNYSYGWRRWFRKKSRDRTPPVPVTNMRIALCEVVEVEFVRYFSEGDYMKKARVTIFWDQSISDDVELQELVVTVGGDQVATESLPFSVNEYTIPALFDQDVVLHVEIVTVDFAGNRSDVTAGDLTIPDFSSPAPVGTLSFSVDIVEDDSVDGENV